MEPMISKVKAARFVFVDELTIELLFLNYQENVALYSIGTNDVMFENEDYGTVRALAKQYIELIKTVQKIGPYYLGTDNLTIFCFLERSYADYQLCNY